ncbi:MAG: hypothetical protein IRY99_12290 [Isosphaeraceae bacterium]|nr:hypothetical protein [Isosphaeraceae bacterium]
MPRVRSCLALILAGLAIGAPVALGADDAATRTNLELRFLQGLRERGYFDLALEYIDQLRSAPGTPAPLKAVLDYEEGRSLLEEASHMADLDRRADQLDKARAKIDAFTRANPRHPLVPEALVQIARLLYERGQTNALLAHETKTPAEQGQKLAAARAAFDQARSAYGQALKPLKAAYDAFPKFLPDDDPRKVDRDRAHVALMDAELQKALVDYEEAQTYPADSKERKALLDKGIAAFNDIYKRYRTQLAGLYARMWEGKCHEEKGDLGPAMGIYKELMDHPAPELRPLKRKVGYFQIVVDNKRGEPALAIDRASSWLQQNPNARLTDEGLGVQLELAKALLARLDELNDNDKAVATRRAIDLLQQVVRVYSSHKPEALALLQKHKPKGGPTNLQAIAALSYEDAYAQAEGAVASHEWDRAIALLKQAVRRADPAKKPDDANKARYLMAYACYQGQRYYEAAALADHMARHYPKWDMAPKAAELGLAAIAGAYNLYSNFDRAADLDRLIDLAQYTAATWPDTEQADFARTVLGEIALERGDYAKAAQAFEAIRPESPRHLDGKTKAGKAHWLLSLALRSEGKAKAKEADDEAKKALDLLKSALDARVQAGALPTDTGFLTNLNALAEVHLGSDRPKEALKLLEPIAAALGKENNLSAEVASLYGDLLSIQLQAHLDADQTSKAIADMRALEKAGAPKAKLTKLYLKLSQSLKAEMDAQQAKNDRTALQRTQAAYKEFLSALASSQAGQSYESLMFAGESMLDLGMAKDAAAIFKKVLDTYSKDAEFQKNPNAATALLRAKLRLAEALRKQKQFQEADKLDEELLKQAALMLDVHLEKGFLLEDWAAAEKSKARWLDSYNYWKKLAGRLERGRPRRLEYYDALYHVAVALQNMGRKAEAAQTLKSVMTLSPTVGSPEMKKKYQDFLTRLGR